MSNQQSPQTFSQSQGQLEQYNNPYNSVPNQYTNQPVQKHGQFNRNDQQLPCSHDYRMYIIFMSIPTLILWFLWFIGIRSNWRSLGAAFVLIEFAMILYSILSRVHHNRLITDYSTESTKILIPHKSKQKHWLEFIFLIITALLYIGATIALIALSIKLFTSEKDSRDDSGLSGIGNAIGVFFFGIVIKNVIQHILWFLVIHRCAQSYKQFDTYWPYHPNGAHTVGQQHNPMQQQYNNTINTQVNGVNATNYQSGQYIQQPPQNHFQPQSNEYEQV